MSSLLADSFSNPYASPPPVAQPTPIVSQSAAKPGSLGIILPGFVLLLVGYLTSNLFLISDLYKLGLGPNANATPSPFAMLVRTAPEQWLLYGLFAAAFIAGAVLGVHALVLQSSVKQGASMGGLKPPPGRPLCAAT